MAYPEVIPPLSPREAKGFLERVKANALTPQAKQFWSTPDQTEVRGKS
jgi:hypothetical protein